MARDLAVKKRQKIIMDANKENLPALLSVVAVVGQTNN